MQKCLTQELLLQKLIEYTVPVITYYTFWLFYVLYGNEQMTTTMLFLLPLYCYCFFFYHRSACACKLRVTMIIIVRKKNIGKNWQYRKSFYVLYELQIHMIIKLVKSSAFLAQTQYDMNIFFAKFLLQTVNSSNYSCKMKWMFYVTRRFKIVSRLLVAYRWFDSIKCY